MKLQLVYNAIQWLPQPTYCVIVSTLDQQLHFSNWPFTLATCIANQLSLLTCPILGVTLLPYTEVTWSIALAS